MSLIRKIEIAPIVLACVTLFTLMTMTFCDVLLRSLFNAPLQAATELTRIMMAVVVFSVLPIMSFHGGHIGVDLIDPYMTGRTRRIRDAIISALCGALLIWPAQRVVVLAERERDYGDVTEYLAIPTFYVSWFIAILTFATAGTLFLRAFFLVVKPRVLEDFE